MADMTVRDIVVAWLKQNGYDGLAGEECGCELANLMPCEEPSELGCVAGHKVPMPPGVEAEGFDFCIEPGPRPETAGEDAP